MKRTPGVLTEKVFDAVIVGGGIHGATLFYQLAATGSRVAMIDKADFCGATSANSLKILHGGLRYLQHLNIKRMRESINSRKYYLKVAPHLIQPMPCIMPTYGLGMQSRPVMGLALFLFSLISWDRNSGALPDNRVGRGRLLSRNQCLKIGPGIAPEGLTGAALWYDDLIVNTERLGLEFIKEGVKLGSTAVNYMRARRFIREQQRITGLEATDQQSGQTCTIRGKVFISAAGPWIDEIRKESHQATITEDLAKAVNIVIDRPLFPGYGVGLAGSGEFVDQDAKIKRGKRLFFFAPWRDKTIIGTTYSYYDGRRDELAVTRADIEEILDEVNTIYPLADLKPVNVIFAHAGLMPAHRPERKARHGTPQLVKHSRVIDHEQLEGLAGLITVEGVKYTTAPAIAREVEQLLRSKGLLAASPSTTGVALARPTPGAAEQALLDRYGPRFPHVAKLYGPAAPEIFAIAAEEAGGGNLLLRRPPLLVAEVRYAVRQEMAVHLDDLLFRRTDCGGCGPPSHPELLAIAREMARELAWNEERLRREVEQVQNHYRHRLSVLP